MRKNHRTGATFTTVVAGAAVLAVFGTGTAVAGSLITSARIKDNTIKSVDVRNNALKGVDVLDGSLSGTDVADRSLTGADVADGSLSNEDVGVLWAQVNADGTLANSSGGDIESARPFGAGFYHVDFGRDISRCAFTATVGTAVAGSQHGIVSSVTDRANVPEAVAVNVTDINGINADRPFQLIVAC